MEQAVLNEILKKHSYWLKGLECGERADLSGADLRGANLSEANLSRADLSGADLRRANLSEANLSEANLSGANLSEANLRRADLRGANIIGTNLYRVNLSEANLRGAYLSEADLRVVYLYGADLRRANLSGANLSEANLRRADLRGANIIGTNLYRVNLSEANLRGAYLSEADLSGADLEYIDLSKAKNVPFIPMTCPESGSFIGWKKAGDKIIKLEILEDSRRSSSTGRKCRCDKAKVLAIENIDGTDSGLKEICSDHDSSFIYKIGEIVEEPNFCTDRFIECAPGIHFFINRGEAVGYV